MEQVNFRSFHHSLKIILITMFLTKIKSLLKPKTLLITFMSVIIILIILTNFTKEVVIEKRLLYLIQTEQCLSKSLMVRENLFKPAECQCDVIVNSHKAECLNIQHKHIVYLYEPNSGKTWATGRNLLYKIAKERKVPYLYYIFLDGDIQLSYNEQIAPKSIMNKSPMRAFEQFLITQKPGVGVTDYLTHHGANHIIPKMHENCNIGVNTDLSNRTSTDSLYLTSVHFDACFNAFHYEIVDHILHTFSILMKLIGISLN